MAYKPLFKQKQAVSLAKRPVFEGKGDNKEEEMKKNVLQPKSTKNA